MNIESNTDLNKWDLEKILEDETLEEKAGKYFTMLKELIEIYEQDIFSSTDRLIKYHEHSQECLKLGNRIFNYLSNKHNEDLSNKEWLEKLQWIKLEVVQYYQKLSDFNIKAVENKKLIETYLNDERLSPLKRYYELIFRAQNHEYPPEIKKFLITYKPLNDSFEQIFLTIRDCELPVKNAKTSKKSFLKIPNYDAFLKTQISEDRILRKNAYYSWHGAVEAMKNTFAKLLYYKLLEQNIDAKNCGFKGGFVEAQAFDDELNLSFFNYLYKKIARFHSEFRKYQKVQKQRIKKIYGLKGIKPWDMKMPVIKCDNMEISINQAQELAIEALSIFGEEYIENVKKAFKENWIDWEIRENKIGGAYCIGGCYGMSEKYILMNYNYRLDGVYTLVHELGHAMHAMEYCKYQTYYASTSIFIAEIPSTLNEIILSLHLLDKYKEDNEKKFYIYDALLNNFFSSTIKQIVLSDWEYSANRLVLEGRVLDSENAKLMYKAKRERYQGNRITKPLSAWKDIALASILTVPHFYSGEFYVYKYAVGQIVAVIIATKIYKEKNQEYLKKYFEFLRSGSSKSNLETLEILGINLEKGAIWTEARDIVKEWAQEYMELSQRI